MATECQLTPRAPSEPLEPSHVSGSAVGTISKPAVGGPHAAADLLPSVTIPTGCGAIRGTGEKFAVNPVTGTGAMTIPIATSGGRSNLTPELSPSCDSGAGNGRGDACNSSGPV